MIDGHVFFACLDHFPSILAHTPSNLRAFYTRICMFLNIDMDEPKDGQQARSSTREEVVPHSFTFGLQVLPFSNLIFDSHLSAIQITTSLQPIETSKELQYVFQDLTHWHNHKKPITQSAPTILSGCQHRREQRRRAEMRNYAASLTNAAGKILSPEIIVCQPRLSKGSTSQKGTQSDLRSQAGNIPSKKIPTRESPKAKKTAKELRLEKTLSERLLKTAEEERKALTAWSIKKKQWDDEKNEKDREAIDVNVKDYLESLNSERSSILRGEILLFRIRNLLLLHSEQAKRDHRYARPELLALVTHLLETLSSCKLTTMEASCASRVAQCMGLPISFGAVNDNKRNLSFSMNIDSVSARLTQALHIFMLLYFGPYMRRDLDSKEDPRVSFKPDGWQRKVLDELDANNSVFVVAPTSSGKTFISFYAMEKVLREDNEGILVYLAPTKALVNQIAAEIHARFSKNYPHATQSTWAIHTRDYRVNNPAGCQILVTVPHILQFMLVSDENANAWSSKIRRIIFDEVHTIGRAEDGLVWEQLLLLSPCPKLHYRPPEVILGRSPNGCEQLKKP